MDFDVDSFRYHAVLPEGRGGEGDVLQLFLRGGVYS